MKKIEKLIYSYTQKLQKHENSRPISAILVLTGSVSFSNIPYTKAGRYDMENTGQTNKTRKERELPLEVLRILACIMVVATHIKLGMTSAGSPDRRRILITVLAGDGVSLFWCITGCFFFQGKKSYKELIRKTFLRIGLPALVLSVILFWLGGFLFGGVTLRQSIAHSPQEWKALLINGFLGGNCVIPRTDHLWFLLVYFLVILLYPMLWGAKAYLFGSSPDEKKTSFKKEVLLVLILFGVLIANDITGNTLLRIRHQGLGGVAGAVPMMVLGSVLYRHRDLYSGSLAAGIAGAFLFVLVCVLWMNTEYRLLLEDLAYEERQCRICGFGYVKMFSLFLMAYGFHRTVPADSRLKRVLLHLGKLSFYIYLVHFPMLTLLDRTGIRPLASRLLTGSVIGELLYPLMLTVALLLFSIPTAEIFMAAHQGLLSLFRPWERGDA